ncbi:MAG: hypothetical protein [Caudoviricetes sp.]|nr:MAG: hypothetical protein [Caudoviricetes sp.]
MHVTELTEKQLRNMDTKRLNEVRKRMLPALGRYRREIDEGRISECDMIHYRKLNEQHILIKELMSEREHLSKKKIKTPRRENKRDRVFD